MHKIVMQFVASTQTALPKLLSTFVCSPRYVAMFVRTNRAISNEEAEMRRACLKATVLTWQRNTCMNANVQICIHKHTHIRIHVFYVKSRHDRYKHSSFANDLFLQRTDELDMYWCISRPFEKRNSNIRLVNHWFGLSLPSISKELQNDLSKTASVSSILWWKC